MLHDQNAVVPATPWKRLQYCWGTQRQSLLGEVGHFVHAFLVWLAARADGGAQLAGDEGTVIDSAVYTRNRNFRPPGSSRLVSAPTARLVGRVLS